ncbi:MAG: type II toxin-antitoxin system VapC family toxin [Beijerinckiaceae bacterium]|nr:type II toxin-antitoxin system VapC family toxin [Beijerinckiaceae bacterium]
MIGLDSNVLLRVLVKDDPEQFRVASRVIDTLSRERPGYVNLVVLAEICWTLLRRYKSPPTRLIGIARTLVESDTIVVQDRERVTRAIALAERHGCGLMDALIGTINADEGCERTMSFDRGALDIAGFQLLTS